MIQAHPLSRISQGRRATCLGFSSLAAGFALALALTSGGCAGETENGACSWLFAPSSFVDAGSLGCSPEPAGQICDPSTGRCQSICEPSQYLLTCRTAVVSGLAIREEDLQDPVVDPGRSLSCQAVQVQVEGSRSETVYCCECAQ